MGGGGLTFGAGVAGELFHGLGLREMERERNGCLLEGRGVRFPATSENHARGTEGKWQSSTLSDGLGRGASAMYLLCDYKRLPNLFKLLFSYPQNEVNDLAF